MFVRVFGLTLLLMCAAVSPDTHERITVVVCIAMTAVRDHVTASESTALLPLELSAIRLRPRSQNRWV